MNRRSLMIRAGGLVAAGGGAWWMRDHVLWPAPRAGFGTGASTPWLPFVRRAPLPTITVLAGGLALTALVDSGAQYSVIDRSVLAHLKTGRSLATPMRVYGVGGGSQWGRGAAIDVELPGLAVRGLHAAVLDLGEVASDPDGLATPLILGRDLLRQVVLDMDPARRRLRFAARVGFTPAAGLKATTARARDGLSVPVTVDAAAIEATIDTGSSGMLALARNTVKATALLRTTPGRSASSLVLGGVMTARRIEARAVTFAGQLYRGVAVDIYDPPSAPGFPDALIGMEAFADRRATLDLGGGTLHISRVIDLTIGR